MKQEAKKPSIKPLKIRADFKKSFGVENIKLEVMTHQGKGAPMNTARSHWKPLGHYTTQEGD